MYGLFVSQHVFQILGRENRRIQQQCYHSEVKYWLRHPEKYKSIRDCSTYLAYVTCRPSIETSHHSSRSRFSRCALPLRSLELDILGVSSQRRHLQKISKVPELMICTRLTSGRSRHDNASFLERCTAAQVANQIRTIEEKI